MTASTEKPRYDWFQSDDFVIISIFIKNASKEYVDVQFKPKESSSSFVIDIENLNAEIEPQESCFVILLTKIEVKLKKKTIGIKWNALEASDELQTQMASSQKEPSYPSSSKKHVDWNKVAVEEDKPEGDQALNALFQQIYKDGSDEVKKAMMKSFYESGGTTLSTNWDEVGKETVPIRPPDGMEARKWDQ